MWSMWSALRARRTMWCSSSCARLQGIQGPIEPFLHSFSCTHQILLTIPVPSLSSAEQSHTEMECSVPLAMKWLVNDSGDTDWIAIGDQMGYLSLYRSASSELHYQNVIDPLNPNSINALTAAEDNQLYVASFGLTVNRVDLESFKTVKQVDVISAVKTLTYCHQRHELIGGTRSGQIMLFDARTLQQNEQLQVHIGSSRKRRRDRTSASHAVTCVQTIDTHRFACGLSSSPIISIWDRRNLSSKWCELGAHVHSERAVGVASLDVDASRHFLVSAVTNDHAYQYDISTGTLLSDHAAPSIDYHQRVAFNCSGQCFAVSGQDGAVRVFASNLKIGPDRTQQPITVLRGHEEECGALQWSPRDPFLLKTTSDDCTIRTWQAGAWSEQAEDDEIIPDAHLSKSITPSQTVEEMIMTQLPDNDGDKENHSQLGSSSAVICTEQKSLSENESDQSLFTILSSGNVSSSLQRCPTAALHLPTEATQTRRVHIRKKQRESLLPFLQPLVPDVNDALDCSFSLFPQTSKLLYTLNDHWSSQ